MKATMIKTIILALMILSANILYAQTNNKLGPGDTLPGTIFPIRNYSSSSINLDDFKDKLIIIDVWDVTCGGCIIGMPKMEQLQEKYKDKIKVILLSDDSWEAIEKLKTHADIVKNTTLPMITGESKLLSKINYVYLPTYIWIKDGKTILNITDSKTFSEAKIEQYLATGQLKAQNKKEIDTKTNKGPLLNTLYPYINEDFAFYSFLWKQGDYRTHTVITISRNDKNRNLVERVKITGNNIRTLYQNAYDNNFKNKSFRRIVFNDPIMEKTDTAEYSYEMIFGAPRPDTAVFNLMRRQLDLNLDLTSKVENRMQDVYVLKRIKGIALSKLTSEKKHITKGLGINDNTNILAIKDAPWVWATELISKVHIVPPYEMIDETGIDIETVVNFIIPQDLSLENLGAVNKKLKEVGLEIEFTKRPLDVVVLYQQ